VAFRTTLIGLGLVGSSIGLALKRTGANLEIVGHDKSNEAARSAHRNGCVDRTEWNLISACDGADLIVISTPLEGIKSTLAAIAAELKEGCVVTDTASLKVPVLNWARQFLPPTVQFVGGHPIVGKWGIATLGSGREPPPHTPPTPATPPTTRGAVARTLDGAPASSWDERPSGAGRPVADLFAGALYCLTPATDTPPAALQRVSDLAEATGAKVYYMEAAEHDGLIAVVEQVPLLMALALQDVVSASPAHREIARLSGVDFTRVVEPLTGDAQKLSEVCDLNAANVGRWLDTLLSRLSILRESVVNQDSPSLQQAFASALEARARWAHEDIEGGETDYGDFSMTRMMLGDTFRPRPTQPK
jgi:prephenate dehydrogenase